MRNLFKVTAYDPSITSDYDLYVVSEQIDDVGKLFYNNLLSSDNGQYIKKIELIARNNEIIVGTITVMGTISGKDLKLIAKRR
jgi:hypothetical protein